MRVASLVLSACFGLVACSPGTSVPASTSEPIISPPTTSPSSTSTVALDPTPLSRKWMLVAQEIVKAGKFSPPASARLYAYAATAYQEVIRTRDGLQAGRAVHDVLVAVAPGSRALLDQRAVELGAAEASDASTASVIDALVKRTKTDGADREATADKTPPFGDGNWVSVGGQVPLGVTAGTWSRWLPAETLFEVPPPPEPGSIEMASQLRATRQAAAARDTRWIAAINYWGGVPGTEAPAGIWQNHLWRRVSGAAVAKNDAAYSNVQTLLAQAIADSFIETWKVKYTYWTARPDMVDPGIATAMANPPFPGYVSGHSTISATAATILEAKLPDRGYWQRSAEEARDSRLYAGIHLDVDNQVGFALGRAIGAAIVARYQPFPDSSWQPNRDAPEPLLLAAPVDGASGVLAAQEAATVSNEAVGNLYRVSKVGHTRAFLVASREVLPLAPGWRALLLSTDGAWEPGACASAPSAVLADRYVVYAEFQHSLHGATSRLVVFDLHARVFRTMVLGSRAVLSISGIDDHTVAVLDQNEPLVRLVNVTDGSYVDRDPTALALSSIDGVSEVPRSNGVDDVTYIDAGGSVVADVFGWRAPQLKGWDNVRGYFMASPTQTSSPAPGVFNAAAGTWEWVFSEEIDDGSGNGGPRYATLGTVPN